MTDISFSKPYQPPGIYVQQQATPLINVVGIAPTVVAIVGPAVGYRANTEGVTLTGTAAVTLGALGIAPASVVVTDPSGVTYVAGTDYTIAQQAGAQVGAQYETTTITRVSAGGIADGTTVFVSYRYTDANYTLVQRFTSFEDVKAQYGQPYDVTSNAIISPLSLAAQIAFTNGATNLVLVATTDSATLATRGGLQAALTQLLTAYDVDVVVVLPVGITGTPLAAGDVINVVTDLKNHVDQASAQNLYRIGIVGHESTVTVHPDVVAATIADARVVLAWPNALSYYNGYNNQTFTLSGYYLAAAYAGIIASQADQIPLTKKVVRGFSGIPAAVFATMTATYKNQLSASGVSVTEIVRNGTMVVRHGVTTNTTSTQSKEISMVRQQDALVLLIYDTIDASAIIGTAITSDTLGNIKTLVHGALQQAVDSSLVLGYENLLVRQSTADPTVVEVQFGYQPAFPLNYVVIKFAIDTTTGNLAVAA